MGAPWNKGDTSAACAGSYGMLMDLDTQKCGGQCEDIVDTRDAIRETQQQYVRGLMEV